MEKNDETEKRGHLITEELFREAYQYEELRKPPLKQIVAAKLKCNKQTFLKALPIAEWLPKYKIKKYIVPDIIAGITVAVMHVPHGLAYAPLGRVDPVVGFYMAIFPVFVYMLLGTSRHISIGTFAVLCAMVGQIVIKYEDPVPEPGVRCQANATTGKPYEGIRVGAAVCLMVGLWQAVLGLLGLGYLTVIMSESLVSGFTTGAAFHVLSYQLKNLFGVHVANFPGILKLFYIYIDFFSKIQTVNLVTMYISLACIIILLIFNLFLKPVVEKACPKNKIPIPIELIVIIVGIVISYFLNLSESHGVRIVGNIPTGFPEPSLPPYELLFNLVFDSFMVAIVALATNLSLAKIFAKKNFYVVQENQELVAYGAANIFAAFFQCLPSAASLSRSSIQFSVGGKTQLASLFSLTLIVFILLAAGTLFEPVPYCVLSSIVAVSLKSLIMQMTDFPKIWRKSNWDGIVWLGTFLAVIVLNIDFGLAVGVLLSLVTIISGSYKLQTAVLGRVPKTNIFLDIARYKAAESVPNILILQVTGNLNFINCSRFEKFVIDRFKKFSESADKDQTYTVLNMSSVTEIDPSSISTLASIKTQLNKSNCDLYLTDCNVGVYRAFEVCNLFDDIPKKQVLASVTDAVEYLTYSTGEKE